MIGSSAVHRFVLSHRLRERYCQLSFPLQLSERPSPEVRQLFWEALSYLRFLGLDRSSAPWQFSLILSPGVGGAPEVPLLPPPARARVGVLLNVSTETRIDVRLRHDVLAIEPLTGCCLLADELGGGWELCGSTPEGMISVVAGITRGSL